MEARKKALGQRLRQARTQAGLSQSGTAAAVSVGRQTYVAWESGRNNVDAIHLAELAELFGVSVDCLAIGLPAVPVRECAACLGCPNYAGGIVTACHP